MAELNPPEGPFALTGPATDVEASKLRHSAATFRRMLAASENYLQGIAQLADLKVTASGTDVNVSVATGDVCVLGTQSTDQGMYHGRNSGTKVINLLGTNPAHATLDRIDLVVARFNDTFYSGGLDTFSIEMVTGTAAGSPVAPAVPANSLVLAQILIVHATTVVDPTKITDKRILSGGRSYKAQALNNANQSIATGGFSKVSLQVEVYDAAAVFDNVTNFRFVAPVAGTYRFFGGIAFTLGANTGRVMVMLYKNGTEYAGSRTGTFATQAGAQYELQTGIDIPLAAGDYVELYAYQNTGVAFNLLGTGGDNCVLTAMYVGP